MSHLTGPMVRPALNSSPLPGAPVPLATEPERTPRPSPPPRRRIPPPPSPPPAPAAAPVAPPAAAAVSPRRPRRRGSGAGWISFAVCLLLLGLFAVLSYSAVLSKSATYDEPLHAVAGQIVRHVGDYRIDPEDGALFLRYGNLLHGADAIHVDTTSPDFLEQRLQHDHQWWLVMRTLYQTGGADADTYLNRSRLMFVIAGVALGAMLCWWAWRLAGPGGAITAAGVYCFDPNFLAHSPLVKNDVPLSLLMLGLAMAVWSAGRSVRWWTVPLLGLICGAALATKFSGLLFGPVTVLLLLARTFMPKDWPVLRWNLHRWPARLGATVAISIGTAAIAYAVVWASYGFRYHPTPDPSYNLDLNLIEQVARSNEIRAGEPDLRAPTTQELETHSPALLVRVTMFLDQHHLMPQTWSFGLLYTYATTLIRSSYLMGDYSQVGWWYYFPAAMLFKTPVATLAAILAAIVAAVVVAAERRSGKAAAAPLAEAGPIPARLDAWTILCLSVVPAIYMLSAITANLNLGLRHVLPVYPFIFLGIAIGITRMVQRWRATGLLVAGVLAAGLVAESLLQYPDYIAFFNAASGGSRGGLYLLSDSNLDWGQDLKALGQWQRSHGDRPLYLNYFGTADPAYYGIRRTDLAGGWLFGQQHWVLQIPAKEPAYIAFSATNLQGTYNPPWLRDLYKNAFWNREPRDVLGGSIYIYDWPLPEQR